MLQSYPWYIADWRQNESVLSLTTEQRGAYRDLLDMCWDMGSLPNDSEALRKLAMCEKAEWRRCWPKLQVFFIEIDGRLHSPKVDEKRPAIIQAKEARQRGAQRTNSDRWANRSATDERSVGDSVSESVSGRYARARTPSPSPSPYINTPLSPSVPNTDTPADDWDDVFANTVERIFNRHAEYRAKSNRQPGWGFQIFARRVQQDLQDAPSRAKLLDRADRAHAFYIASVDDPKFCLSLDKWWNSGEWQNEPPEPKPADDDMWRYEDIS